ncbi:fatty acid-binding protein, liver-like [Anneissia japonica]|uniref:fatty acid-binding protein, liver-like n=1 Tax=Anneissia japonica TaxID=1529436 RepID=UPI001425829E|nr:fatty acid-binding protein, liver-like [Anneissia japonica]
MSADKFKGVYGLHKSENFDAYMKALGVGMVLRNLGNTAKPTLTVTVEGDKMTFHSKTTLKTTVIEFTIGVESESTTMDGRKIKSTVVWDGEKLKEEQVSVDGKGKPTTIVREINADGDLVITCTVDDIVGVRVYRKK